MNYIKMNKKGNTFVLFFWILTFIPFWVYFFGPVLSEWGKRAIIENNMIGIEAFLYGNLNLAIFFFLLLVMFGVGFVGDRR